MITYAEANRRKPFDWNAFLNQETYTEDELINARYLSASWVTCACGNQCEILPRNNDGSPEDNVLRVLGIKFNDAIHAMYEDIFPSAKTSIENAKSILRQIEERSAYLLNMPTK